MFKNEDKCYSQRHVSWVWLKVRTKRAANILEKKILKRSYLPVRNVKQNIHSPQRHKGTISSGTQVCQVLLPLSSTPLVCSPHCHYPCSGKLDKVCFSPDEELWMCKREPFWQKSVYRGQLLCFLLHRHLATGGSRNRIRHKSEFKKKPLWFERTTAKNPQMPMREHKVCKSEWTPTSSKAHSGAADPREKNIWCYQLSTGPWRNTSSKPRKHPYTTQAVPQLGKSLEGTSGKGGAAAGLVPTAKMHQAQTTECVTGPLSTAGLKPRATRLEVSGMSQSIQTASCSWRHFVSWKNQDTGTVWVTWLGLGHEAIVKMGRKYNCKSTKCKKPAKLRQDLTWERFMPKVMFWKDSTEEGFFPSLWWSSTSEWKEQWQCPVSELCPRHQPMTHQATQIWSSQPLKQENWHDLSWFYWLSLWK